MIDQVERLIKTVADATDAVDKLHAAIDALPDSKTIEINVIYKTSGGPENLGTVTQFVEQVNVPAGGSANLTDIQEMAAEMRDVAAAANEAASSVGVLTGQELVNTAAEDALRRAMDNQKTSARTLAEVLSRVTTARREARIEAENMAAAEEASAIAELTLNDAFRQSYTELDQIIDAERRYGEAVTEMQALEEAEASRIAIMADEEHAQYRIDEALQQNREEINQVIAAEREYGHTAQVVQLIEEARIQRLLEAANAQEENVRGIDAEEAALRSAREMIDAFRESAFNLNSEISGEARVLRVLGLEAESTGGILRDFGVINDNVSKSKKDGAEAIRGEYFVLYNFAQAARYAGTNVGGMLIPLGAAAFGITGLGTAIHLIVMGTFEFLAVFIPAMYAAAAAAAVMVQGVQLVKTHLQGLYTATEALGPMFNTTAGDMLGLGHSLQTAQNMANPLVYEAFGEALIGVKEAVGPTTNGLSAFGQMGLDVTRILDTFIAKVDVDLRNSMDQIHSLLAHSVQDLVGFGQIFGNLGHALLNFAADMPGAAEVVLKLIDAITRVIKWISQLPAPLIYAIMIIEELYRWSGILVGVFGLVGRAIGLLGTLGIPVFAKIGANVAAMAANVVSGVATMIINFVAGGEKIGVFGSTVDKAATGVIGVLGKTAAFLTGPWGIAVGLGALALGALIIGFHGTASAAQQFITSSQNAVQSATNLNALNVIGQQMVQTNQQIASTARQLGQAQSYAAQTAQQAGGVIGGVASRFDDVSARAAGAAMHVQQVGNSFQALTSYQRQLVSQNTNVISGAIAISKEFGVNFTSALGMADLAGVKLSNTTVKFGQDANQAGIQLEGLYLGYQKMDQTGSTLANTMNAVNIQAGLQATKVQQVNQAWDAFINMSTGLTSAYSQFNLDLEQMGNLAQVTGTKIRGFTGTTTLSVGQIATALTSFKGSSAQVWQAFDQSVSQANTFMDNLRVAAAAGVVPQKDFTQAIASVVGQLIPYATKSRAALAEVEALAAEAGGPASGNLSTLQNWVDKNAVSSQNFTNMIDTLTQKISNVSAVAKNFAGTLQQDVINAMAQAATSTSNITQLTQNYVESLKTYGNQAPQTKQAQDALTSTLKQYGFTQPEINQQEQIMTTAFGHNATAASGTTYQAQRLAQMVKGNLTPALQGVPRDVHTNITATASGSGMVSYHESMAGLPQTGRILFAAAGAKVTGGTPGRDSVLAMLEPGEAVVPKHLTPVVAPLLHANKVPGFATGGYIPNPNGPEQFMTNAAGQFVGAAEAAWMKAASQQLQKALQQQVAAMSMTGMMHPTGTGATIQALMQSMAASIGWTGAQWAALNAVEMREAGYNMLAVNPSSGAFGLAQFINGPGEYYQYGGDPNNAAGQITAMFNYIRQRYGNPGAAWAHEVAYGWYDNGGLLMPGLTLAFNGTGQPERVGGSGEASMIHNVIQLDGRTIWENQQQYTLRYNLRNHNTGSPTGSWVPNR